MDQPNNRDQLQYNREVIGKEFYKATHTITLDMIVGFSKAIGETNPLFTDECKASLGPYGGLVAPPTLLASFVRGEEPKDLNLEFDGTIFMASQWVEPIAPVRPGDVLTCTAKITDVYRKTGRSGDMAFVVVEHSFRNQDGNLVANAGRSMVRRQ